MAAPEAVDAFEMPAPIVITGTGTYSFGNSVLTVTSLDMLPDKAEWGTLYISASYIQRVSSCVAANRAIAFILMAGRKV